jgi:hypothetical protein
MGVVCAVRMVCVLWLYGVLLCVPGVSEVPMAHMCLRLSSCTGMVSMVGMVGMAAGQLESQVSHCPQCRRHSP